MLIRKGQGQVLGQLCGRSCHRPIVDKVEAIMKLQPPTTKKGLRSFIGMVNFYKHYIKEASLLLKPLTDMTSKKFGNKIQFGENQIKAFDKVKQALADCTDLFAPQYDKPFILRTDASDTCVAGVLSQEGVGGGISRDVFIVQAHRAYATILDLRKRMLGNNLLS